MSSVVNRNLKTKKHLVDTKKSTSWITIGLNQVTQIQINKVLWALWETFLVKYGSMAF